MNIDYTGVERPMTKADKGLWVEALRSGDYRQGNFQLFDSLTNKHCCLGVADTLFGLRSNSEGVIMTGEDASPTLLPIKTQEALYHMNDVQMLDFYKIADYIEANINAVDE